MQGSTMPTLDYKTPEPRTPTKPSRLRMYVETMIWGLIGPVIFILTLLVLAFLTVQLGR